MNLKVEFRIELPTAQRSPLNNFAETLDPGKYKNQQTNIIQNDAHLLAILAMKCKKKNHADISQEPQLMVTPNTRIRTRSVVGEMMVWFKYIRNC